MSEQSGQQGSNQQLLQAQVQDRASKDQAFRQQLMEDPKGTLEATFDVQIPDFIEIQVVEESPSRIYLVLPPAAQEAGQELSDQDLQAVSGGWTETTACGSTCAGVFSCPVCNIIPPPSTLPCY